MNNSIVMDIILSLSLVFIYYIYTKFDKEIEVVNTRQMVALFIINMVIFIRMTPTLIFYFVIVHGNWQKNCTKM